PYGYLVKPYKDEELNASIITTIHKHKYFYRNKRSLEADENQKISIHGNMTFNRGTSILYIEDKPKKLTGNETKFFEILCHTPGESVTFEKISSYIWREDVFDLGRLRTLVYRLRNKIDEDPFENIFEVGYRVKLNNG
ncbi:MAG: winged helix-turn-helix domain-containing protein, partial [Campylobacterales bacterium]|nr:winged helix-turn-helix domain-containing protein [Campylobacterales bacterium]